MRLCGSAEAELGVRLDTLSVLGDLHAQVKTAFNGVISAEKELADNRAIIQDLANRNHQIARRLQTSRLRLGAIVVSEQSEREKLIAENRRLTRGKRPS